MPSRFVIVGAVVFSTTAWAAQDVIVRPGAPPPAQLQAVRQGPARGTLDDVVARLLSYDTNKDGRLTKDEIPDRLLDLLPKGDSNSDAVLDSAEIRAMAQRPGFVGGPGAGRRGAAGAVRLAGTPRPPPIAGAEGALADLKLPPDRRAAALEALLQHHNAVSRRTQDSVARLIDDVRGVLTSDRLAAFLVAVERQPASVLILASARGAAAARATVSVPRVEMDRTLDGFQLPPASRAWADAALTAHLDRVVAIAADDSRFRLQLQGILTAIEFADFMAALERQRPLVTIVGGPIPQSGVIRGGPPPPPPPPGR